MTISVEALTFKAVIGILDFERTAPQSVRADIRIGYRYEAGSFIDYARIAEVVRQTVTEKRFGLLEEAIETLAACLKSEFPAIETLELSLCKPDILPDCSVTLTERFEF